MGEDSKKFSVKDFCVLNKFDIVCFQETKLEVVNERTLKKIGGNFYMIGCFRML